jgi:hypothetical protein
MRRDPRLDPAPGDVLERGGLEYRIEFGGAPKVGYFIPALGLYFVGLPQWKRLMKSARVVSTAASEGSQTNA